MLLRLRLSYKQHDVWVGMGCAAPFALAVVEGQGFPVSVFVVALLSPCSLYESHNVCVWM
jgi:hypothetical protein